MALTLGSIYKPINEFFLNLYKTDAESPVFFKFDKFGSVISDGDFKEVSDNTGLILERFSDMVNRLPIEDGDGLNVLFSTDTIDDIYFYKLLNASIPYVSDENRNKDDIINAVSKIISDAKNEFEKSSLARQGIATLFRASYAFPDDWYNSDKKEIWTTHSFQVGETVITPAPDNNPKFQLWKLRVDDAVLKNVLSIKTTESVKPAELYQRVLLMKTSLKPMAVADVRPQVMHPAAAAIATAASVSTDTIIRDHRLEPAATITDHRVASLPKDNFIFHHSLQTAISRLNLKQRYVVNEYIKTSAPTQASTTNSINISFDYCKVDIRRPWLFNAFINDGSWFIPGLKKGQLSAPDPDTDLTVLPIGFVVIKNLSIEANWSNTDIVNSKNATDFGPFEVDSEIVNNKLSHSGIQIIGWILQQMPALPPNDPPN